MKHHKHHKHHKHPKHLHRPRTQQMTVEQRIAVAEAAADRNRPKQEPTLPTPPWEKKNARDDRP